MTSLEPLMGRHFIEYASYVIVDRAIPDIRDGLKPVQRRILATLHKVDDGAFHKVANIIGEAMKLHPHGDASIGDALVVLANKECFIDKQGNFGNIVTGHPAAAARYTECRLTDLARETMFSKALTEYQPSYDGRNHEPVALPAKLPVVLLLGTEGIAVGMSTRILPHNFVELLEAQIGILEGEEVEVLPDFVTGGIVDVDEYDDGRGKVKLRARIDKADEKTVVIREIPYSTTTESLISSIEGAAQKGKLRIGSINDFTTDTVEIEVGLPRGVYADEVIPQLYAHTDCEVSISSNIVLIRERRPVEMTVSEVLAFLTDQVRDHIRAELEFELAQLSDRKHRLTLERIFIEERVYRRIEEADTDDDVRHEVRAGLEPYRALLDRDVSDEDVARLLEIPIRRISRYDLDRNRRDVESTEAAIADAEIRLAELTATTIEYLRSLLSRYGERFPRRTEISRFEAVDVRAVARQNIKVGYDPGTGFFGSEVKGVKHQLTVSEYDRILLVCRDGSFRIVGPEEKVLIPGKLLYMDLFDQEQGKSFTVVYRDRNRIAYAKKVHIKAFIRDREYELIKGKAGKIDLLLPGDADLTLRIDFVPAKRQRVHNSTFDVGTLSPVGVNARGSRLAAKPVARIVRVRKSSKAKDAVKGKGKAGKRTGKVAGATARRGRKAPKDDGSTSGEDDGGQQSLF